MSLLADARMTARYLAGLRAFWRAPENWHAATDVIRGWLAERDAAFLRMLAQHVFGNPRSPYLPLLQAARLTLPDAERLVSQCGLEGALRRLYEAGVYVTLDEFKGRRPIQRNGVERAVAAGDFRAAAGEGHFTGHTGGSRTRGTPVAVSLSDMMAELPARALFLQAHGLTGRPWAQWWAAPPGVAGLRTALRNVKQGQPLLRWFSPTRPGLGPASGKSVVLTWCTVLGSALMGHRIPYPRHVPMDRADVIARWMAQQKARGVQVSLETMASGAVRVAQAAQALGLDIAGHVMHTGGEPLTPAKVAVLEDAGLRLCSKYATVETAALGLSCGAGSAPDDMHLLTYRMAVIQERKSLLGWPEPVGALLLTFFSPHMANVLLNVEIGDYGVLGERDCGCPLGAAGLHTHLHTIRSFEKLTSVGMHFMGADLLDLLETALPARFGGGPVDYQFVEAEVGGATVLKLVVAPGVGPLDEREVLAFTLAELERRTKAGRMMTDIWRDAGVLQLERSQLYTTRASKIQPLHVERAP